MPTYLGSLIIKVVKIKAFRHLLISIKINNRSTMNFPLFINLIRMSPPSFREISNLTKNLKSFTDQMRRALKSTFTRAKTKTECPLSYLKVNINKDINKTIPLINLLI